MPAMVREGLFIGDIRDAAEIITNGSSKITHILSLLSSAYITFFSDWRRGFEAQTKEVEKVYKEDGQNPTTNGSSSSDEENQAADKRGKLLYNLELVGPELNILRMGVPLRDMENENLLDYLDTCLGFIERGRREGAILVHCFAGVSRSASVVTAYLMKTEQLSQEDALESLRQQSESACPNDGFLEQLKMFEEMGFKVDHASSIYKKFRLKILGEAYGRGEKIDSSKFEADPGLPILSPTVPVEMPTSQECNDREKLGISYRCKMCRRAVASKDNVVSHLPGEGEPCFKLKNRSRGSFFDDRHEPECTSVFVEPLQWMTTVEEGAIEGKLSCIGCQARLGYFNWSGIQCSCGTWVNPAFQLHKSRVDACKI
ncbi:hypothetical protein SUGI_1022050 [Cryptomeria japonica]|uniref:uncharacterized protein LOC131035468 n=1 Tax=Cryptomeria japonica TaxID=3369 RepID=UPI002414CE9C|nr:uncharacterized protein LOC131035468 [Cryptomeria japonica]GLJ48420.1 hypothetical protein SUGI_1022050 [Cryptomeria japonica]